VKRPLAGDGEVAWRKYAEYLEGQHVYRGELDHLAARIDGIKSGLLLRLDRIDRKLR
jgi:hypothetical protein